jgi:hypothetical protein
MIPFILIITLQNMNSIFCVFLSLRDLNRVKWSLDFLSINFTRRQRPGTLGPQEGSPEAQKILGGMAPTLGHATHALFFLECCQPAIFISDSKY